VLEPGHLHSFQNACSLLIVHELLLLLLFGLVM